MIRQSGFTLIELMLSLTLGLIITAACDSIVSNKSKKLVFAARYV